MPCSTAPESAVACSGPIPPGSPRRQAVLDLLHREHASSGPQLEAKPAERPYLSSEPAGRSISASSKDARRIGQVIWVDEARCITGEPSIPVHMHRRRVDGTLEF